MMTSKPISVRDSLGLPPPDPMRLTYSAPTEKICPCGKKSYSSKGAAKKAIYRIHSSAGRHHKLDLPYKCPESGQWHLTSDKSRA